MVRKGSLARNVVSSAFLKTDTPQSLEPGSALVKFNEIVGVIGLYEICTCFLFSITGVTITWQIMIHQFVGGKISQACGIANLTACDPDCPQVIFPSVKNGSSIIMEWNLVCDEGIKPAISQTILIIGQMVGALFFGHLADQCGRRPCLLAACMIMLVSGLLTAITPWFWLYCLSKFFVGLSCSGQSLSCLVFLVEYFHVDKREAMIVLFAFPYALGYTSLPIISLFLTKWRHLQLTVTALGVVFLSYFWLLPESPRWLLLMGYVDRCTAVLQSSSKNKGISQAQLQQIIKDAHRDLIAADVAKHGTMFDLFRFKILRRNVCVLGLTWFNIDLKFCCMLEYVGYVSQNKNINLGLGAFLTLIGTICAYPMLRFATRRVSVMLTSLLCIACLLPIPIIPHRKDHLVSSSLAMIVLGISSLTFVVMNLYSTELLPTVVRNSGIGLTMCISRLGCLISSYVLRLGKIKFYVPVLVYIASLLVTAFLIFLLPETKGEKLPDTIEEGEDFGKAKKNKRNVSETEV